MQQTDKNIIMGRNPVMEALSSGKEMEKLHVCKGTEGSIKKITAMARDRGVPIHYEENEVFRKLTTGNHQGVIAVVSAFTYCDVDDILSLAEKRGEKPFIIILDGVEDPHNLGAVIRTAEAAGAHGVIIPKRRSAAVTETVIKASAGATEYMLCARVSNIVQTIERLKDKGLWMGVADTGGEPYHRTDLKGAIGLVIGGEGAGVGRLVKEKCDFTLSIKMKGRIGSLNVSNAAAVLMYEVQRQRDEG